MRWNLARVSPIVSSLRRRVMLRSALRQSNLFADAPHEGDVWSERLLAAFADATSTRVSCRLRSRRSRRAPAMRSFIMLAARRRCSMSGRARPCHVKRFSKVFRTGGTSRTRWRSINWKRAEDRALLRAIPEQRWLPSGFFRAGPSGCRGYLETR